ncbi:MAG: hypothetical protein M3328_07440, partial [Chloroflexota bacterium]|nr:hypothetical protein [Chloroflexota bacterium]
GCGSGRQALSRSSACQKAPALWRRPDQPVARPRRLERLPQTSKASIYIAMSRLTLMRLA